MDKSRWRLGWLLFFVGKRGIRAREVIKEKGQQGQTLVLIRGSTHQNVIQFKCLTLFGSPAFTGRTWNG